MAVSAQFDLNSCRGSLNLQYHFCLLILSVSVVVYHACHCVLMVVHKEDFCSEVMLEPVLRLTCYCTWIVLFDVEM